MTDAELVRGASGGNAEAWQTLYKRYLPLVWRQAYALVQDTHVAEDVTSEAMLAFLQGIGRMDADAPRIAAWLRTVVRYKAADHLRQVYRTRDKLPRVADNADATSRTIDPVRVLETAETKALVWNVLEEMSERQRIVLEWKYLDALCVREIAGRLGATEKAAEAVLYRARREFRRLFEATESEGASVNRSRRIATDSPQES